MKKLLYGIMSVFVLISCSNRQHKKFLVMKTDAEWKKQLTDEQYRIARNEGTEPPFNNTYWDNHERGVYKCIGCGAPLFSSDTKYESGTGWPSFYEAISSNVVGVTIDESFGIVREEVHCSRCGCHLGHVFKDGPKPTGLRYCMNSASLNFVKN